VVATIWSGRGDRETGVLQGHAPDAQVRRATEVAATTAQSRCATAGEKSSLSPDIRLPPSASTVFSNELSGIGGLTDIRLLAPESALQSRSDFVPLLQRIHSPVNRRQIPVQP
jgi:hypothetical protein